VVGGRDPGYPQFLAVVLAFGGNLGSVVILQEAAWVALMLALAATAHFVTRWPYCLWAIILVVMYPGLLIYRNIIAAELLYCVFLNLAACGLLLSITAKSAIRCWMIGGAIVFAALAACYKSQGLLVSITVIALGIWIAGRDPPRRLMVVLISCLAALSILATGSRIGASRSDVSSVVFVGKTLFCNHLDLVLASDAARREIVVASGDHANAMVAHLTADFASSRERWPTLGFFGDECLFDAALDQALTANGKPAIEAAAAYHRIFLRAIGDHPLLYLSKVGYQMWYAVWHAWPAHGLELTVPFSSDDIVNVSQIINRHGLPAATFPSGNQPIRGWIPAGLKDYATYLFKGLSAAFVGSVVFWMANAWTRARPKFTARAGVIIGLWVASILSSAAAHTVDVVRYLVPATPMLSLLLAMLSAELAKIVGGFHRRPATNS
jgi:hypothetical protein